MSATHHTSIDQSSKKLGLEWLFDCEHMGIHVHYFTSRVLTKLRTTHDDDDRHHVFLYFFIVASHHHHHHQERHDSDRPSRSEIQMFEHTLIIIFFCNCLIYVSIHTYNDNIITIYFR